MTFQHKVRRNTKKDRPWFQHSPMICKIRSVITVLVSLEFEFPKYLPPLTFSRDWRTFLRSHRPVTSKRNGSQQSAFPEQNMLAILLSSAEYGYNVQSLQFFEVNQPRPTLSFLFILSLLGYRFRPIIAITRLHKKKHEYMKLCSVEQSWLWLVYFKELKILYTADTRQLGCLTLDLKKNMDTFAVLRNICHIKRSLLRTLHFMLTWLPVYTPVAHSYQVLKLHSQNLKPSTVIMSVQRITFLYL
jgi:hypothetical protein